MATTRTDLAVRLLRELDRLSVGYRVLHRADDIRDGLPISDADIVVDRDPIAVLRALAEDEGGHGLSPVMLWNYDHGSLTSFWSTPDGSDGVQLDLLHDPHGHGRYGVRSGAALRLSPVEDGVWPPRLSESTELVYLLSKRIVKGDRVRAGALADVLRDRQRSGRSDDVAGELLSARALVRHRRFLDGHQPGRFGPVAERWRSRIGALGVRRLLDPVGHVINVGDIDTESLTQMVGRFERFLVHVVITDLTPLHRRLAAWWAVRTPTLVIDTATSPRHSRLVSFTGVASTDSADVVSVLGSCIRTRLVAGPHG